MSPSSAATQTTRPSSAAGGKNARSFFRTCGEQSVALGDLGLSEKLGGAGNLRAGRFFWRAGFSLSLERALRKIPELVRTSPHNSWSEFYGF
jgi:hypothetical protein